MQPGPREMQGAAEVSRLTELLPRGVDIAAGKAGISDEPWIALAQAQGRQREALVDLLALGWWKTVENPHKAEAALRRAARTGPDRPSGAA